MSRYLNPHIDPATAAQAQKVNTIFFASCTVTPEYEREFDLLADMRRAEMTEQYRNDRGLPPNGKTPYDHRPEVTKVQ